MVEQIVREKRILSAHNAYSKQKQNCCKVVSNLADNASLNDFSGEPGPLAAQNDFFSPLIDLAHPVNQ